MDRSKQLQLIRCYVDGEVTPDQAALVESWIDDDPAVGEIVAFERCLHQAVTSGMSKPTAAPAELRQRVLDSLADEPLATLEAGATPATRRPRWWSTARANGVMIAATLLIVSGAVLVGIFGPRIDEFQLADRDLTGDVALWASSEHGRCTSERSHTQEKACWCQAQEASVNLTQHLRRQVIVAEDLLADLGYAFLGAGPCRVPGGQPSGHVLYVRSSKHERGGAMISLFIVPDIGQFDEDVTGGMEPGEWYTSNGGPQCVHQIFRCTDADIVYFLVCCDEQDLDAVTEVVAAAIRSRPVR